MSEAGEYPQPTFRELRIDPNSDGNSLLIDVAGEQPAIEELIKSLLYKIRSREIPPTNDEEAENLRLDIDDLFEAKRSDIEKYFNGGVPTNSYIGTNWEIRAYIKRDRQQPGVYHLTFHDNANMQRVEREGLELSI